MDLVPQLHTADQANSDASNSIKSNPNYKEILGFNELDINQGSYTDCVNLWPQVVANGLCIGSPVPACTTLQPGNWFVEFMSAIAATGSHVDLIALHVYGQRLTDIAGSVTNIKVHIQSFYAQYRLPIWLTETAMATCDGKSGEQNGYYANATMQAGFAAAPVKVLEGLGKNVRERDAWFAVGEGEPSDLIDSDSGALYTIGQAYAAV
ncbi:hypothetical protein MMC27_002040 [Xylographa pallens]|nr:hypothetical protein [Xylographa pallens]